MYRAVTMSEIVLATMRLQLDRHKREQLRLAQRPLFRGALSYAVKNCGVH